MSFTNETTHYGLPQWIGSDKPTYLVDQNNAYQKIDSELYNANVEAGTAVATANGAASTAASAAETAAGAVTTAQAAAETANTADGKADSAISQAQAAQTAAGAAQTAAQAAQEAAAGNSITNLAPAYDPTITYAIDALVTAEGKLYKCIVAVDTPEQFDINKWDDVTTSEVYAKKSPFVVTDNLITIDSGNNIISTIGYNYGFSESNNRLISFMFTIDDTAITSTGVYVIGTLPNDFIPPRNLDAVGISPTNCSNVLLEYNGNVKVFLVAGQTYGEIRCDITYFV